MAEAKQNLIGDDGIEIEVVAAGAEAPKVFDSPLASKRPARRYYPQVELTLARLREFSREPELIFWVFIFPLLLAFSLGIAFRNTGPERVYIALENHGTNSEGATLLAGLLANSPEIHVISLSTAEATAALRSGKVAVVVIATDQQHDQQPDATGSAGKSTRPSFDYRFDPSRPESRLGRLVVDSELQRALGRADVVSTADQKISEPGARYIDFLIPGLLGMSLMGGGFIGVGMTIVVARTRKLLKRFAATPMRRSHYLASFVYSRLIFLVLEVTAILVFAWFTFGFTTHGSMISMAFLLLVGGFTFAGLGLLIAARTQTAEGFSGFANLTMMPMWLLSGTFFSPSRFPEFLQPYIKALPLTALNNSLRAVMNDGAPLTAHWLEVCILLAWGSLSFLIALKIFRWQ